VSSDASSSEPHAASVSAAAIATANTFFIVVPFC
jgi:hypothetical protein